MMTRGRATIALLILGGLAGGCRDELPTGAPAAFGPPVFDLTAGATLTQLDPLPGWSRSLASDVNSAGQVVGLSHSGGLPGRATVWTGGTPANLGMRAGDTQSWAYAINDAGVAVGFTSGTTMRAAIFSGGTVTLIPTLGGAHNRAHDINSSGDIVGWSRNASNEDRAFLYSGGVLTELPPLPGGFRIEAYAINDDGVVVGESSGGGTTHAVYWEAGVVHDLGGGASAQSINTAGVIAGSTLYHYPTFRDHATVWSGSDHTLLQDGPTRHWTIARGINNSGTVVGTADSEFASADGVPVIWRAEAISYLPLPAAGWRGSAHAINGSGTVVGAIQSPTNVQRAAVWTVDAPPTAPTAPSGLVAVTVSKSAIDLTWTDASSTEDLFEIQRRQNYAGSWSAWRGFTLAAGRTTYSSTGLSTATAYEFRVRACNGACSAWSNSSIARTKPLPVAPANIAATAISPTQVDLTWDDMTANETGFEIERAERIADAWVYSPLTSVAAGTESYSDLTAEPYTAYRYRVRACVIGGCSTFNQSLSVRTPTDAIAPPAAPSGVNAVAIAAGQVDISWTDTSSDENRFQLYRRMRNGDGTLTAWALIATLPEDSSVYTDLTTSGGTEYRYRVRACNPIGCSSFALGPYVTTP